ncbi:MAG: 50S ribosomal protein L25 [Candidatus Roizmanbacteria bacterium]
MTASTQKHTLACTPRTTLGKQNRSLRKSGNIPAAIFGEGKPTAPVTLSAIEFGKVFAQTGETTVIYCVIDGTEVPTLVADLAINPVLETVDHVDFRRVNLKKKISAQVPVRVSGESLAVKMLSGVLLQQVQEIEVEALPQNIPQEITVDISGITEIGQEIKVSNLAVSTNYTILEDASRVLVSVVAHKEESTESQLERSETEITTAKVEGEGEEGAEAAPGEAPAGDKKAEPAKEEAKKPEAKK